MKTLSFVLSFTLSSNLLAAAYEYNCTGSFNESIPGQEPVYKDCASKVFKFTTPIEVGDNYAILFNDSRLQLDVHQLYPDRSSVYVSAFLADGWSSVHRFTGTQYASSETSFKPGAKEFFLRVNTRNNDKKRTDVSITCSLVSVE